MSGHVNLRPYRQEDIEPLFNLIRRSIPEISPWMSWCHDDYAIEETELWVRSRAAAWRERSAFSFIITAADDTLLGTCGLSHLNWLHQLANLGYWVGTPHTGKGIATAAVRKLAAWAFTQQALVRLEIVMALDNQASRRVAEKAGAHYEGIQRNRLTHGSRVLDAHMYSLIPSDLDAPTR